MTTKSLFARIYEHQKMDRFNQPSRTTFALSVGVLVAFVELSIISVILHWPVSIIIAIFILAAVAVLISTYWNYARHRSTAPAKAWAERTATECWNEASGISRAPEEL